MLHYTVKENDCVCMCVCVPLCVSLFSLYYFYHSQVSWKQCLYSLSFITFYHLWFDSALSKCGRDLNGYVFQTSPRVRVSYCWKSSITEARAGERIPEEAFEKPWQVSKTNQWKKIFFNLLKSSIRNVYVHACMWVDRRGVIHHLNRKPQKHCRLLSFRSSRSNQ